MINQCCQLERSVKRSGRDEISHPTHGHDDLINSVAGVAAVVSRRALHEQVPFVQPGVWSKSGGGWISDPVGVNNKTATQKFYEYYGGLGGYSGAYWPGSGPREY